MNVLVFDRPDSWHVSDLRRAAGCRHQVAAVGYDQLSVELVDGATSRFFAGNQRVENFDAIVTRAMPSPSLEQVVFRMDWLDQVQRQLAIPVINPAKAIEASVDKYLSLEKIRAEGISVPKTAVCQTAEAAISFLRQHRNDVVVKPIFGSQGRGVMRLNDEREARNFFEQCEHDGRVLYLQEYIEHGDWDLRLLVIGNKVYSMRRCRPNHWVTNASLGAECSVHHASESEIEIALNASNAQGAIFAGVDLVYGLDGQGYVVEVNSNPSWHRIADTLSLDIANELINFIASIAGQMVDSAKFS